MLLNVSPPRPINLNHLKHAITNKICAILDYLERDANVANHCVCHPHSLTAHTKDTAINTIDGISLFDTTAEIPAKWAAGSDKASGREATT
jgi:hypothetical protein